MTRPLRVQYPDALYHVTCRGIERREIFSATKDREKFLEILSLSIEIYGVDLYGFILMRNHFHFVVRTPRANLSEFMRHFNISYTGYYNRRYTRAGNLYQGRYKSLLIEDEDYLNKVIHYIHLNPVRIKGRRSKDVNEKLDYLKIYRWSSLPGYLDKKKRYVFVNNSFVLSLYGDKEKTRKKVFLKEMIDHLTGKESFNLKKETIGQVFLSSKKFAAEIIKGMQGGDLREVPQRRSAMKEVLPEQVIKTVEKHLQRPYDEIISERGVNTWLLMDMLYRFSGLKQIEIGKLIGRDYSTVSQSRKRLRRHLDKDRKIGKLYKSIEKNLLCQE